MPRISRSARKTLTEERRKQILDAASKVFAAKGFERATIADVAKEAGIAEGSIYNYFKNKADLLISIPRQIIQPNVEAVMGMMHVAAESPMPPEQLLPIVARNMVNVFQQNGHVFRILFSALPTMTPSVRADYLNRVIFYIWDILEAYLRELVEKGILRQDLDPRILTRVFVGMFIPFALLNFVLSPKDLPETDYDQVISEAVTVFLRGALAEEMRGTPSKQRKKIAVE